MRRVGDRLKAENAGWNFGGETAKNFDDHVLKSVPLYTTGHDIVCALSDFFIEPGSTAYDIGWPGRTSASGSQRDAPDQSPFHFKSLRIIRPLHS